jgi:nucleoside-diphosphate-sugar epimerase
MREASAALMAKAFPGVPVKAGIGEHETLLSIDKARRILGYHPKYTWRGQL